MKKNNFNFGENRMIPQKKYSLLFMRMSSVAHFLDNNDRYEDANVIDDFIETIAKHMKKGNHKIIKEAGVWTNLLSRLSGTARKILFSEYRKLFQDATDTQQKLDQYAASLLAQVNNLKRHLNRHNLQEWRQGVADVMTEISIPDFDALTQYDGQHNQMIQQVFKNVSPESQQQLPEAAPHPSELLQEKIEPENKTPEEVLEQISERRQQAELQEVEKKKEIEDLSEIAQEIKPVLPPAVPQQRSKPPQAPPTPSVEETAPTVLTAPAETEVAPTAPAETEVVPTVPTEKATVPTETAPPSIPAEIKDVIQPSAPEEAMQKEEQQAELDNWDVRIFKGVKPNAIEYPLKINEDGTKISLTFDQYKQYVMGINAEDLPPEARKGASKNRPLRETNMGIIPNWGTAPNSLILFMGPYLWEAKAIDDNIILSKTKTPMSFEHAPPRQQQLFRRHLEKLKESQKEAFNNRINKIISLSAKSRKNKILHLAQESINDYYDDDYSGPSIDDLEDAAEELLL